MGQDQDKVLGHLDGQQQVFVKLAGPQAVNVQEDREASQLQVDLQQTDQAKCIVSAQGRTGIV